MSDTYASGVTVTFTPVFNGKYLFVQRHPDDKILGGYWCFPGGRVHAGETVSAALKRECLEETGLVTTGRAFFVDSYLLGDRLGLHFAVEVTSDEVILQDDELVSFEWLVGDASTKQYSPRIPGIDNHLHYIHSKLSMLADCSDGKDAATSMCLESLCWQSLEDFDLVKDRFINK